MPYALCPMSYALYSSFQDALKKKLLAAGPFVTELKGQRFKIARSAAKEAMEKEDQQLISMVNACEAAVAVMKCVTTTSTDEQTYAALAKLVQLGGTLSVTFARLFVKVSIHHSTMFGKYAEACSLAVATSPEVSYLICYMYTLPAHWHMAYPMGRPWAHGPWGMGRPWAMGAMGHGPWAMGQTANQTQFPEIYFLP